MNKRGHVVNAIGVSLGITAVLNLETGVPFPRTAVAYGVPIVLGALFPDVDTVFGTHRQTLHNFGVLGLAIWFPLAFGNLRHVWIGIATHYVLDLLGNVKGMAVFYPYTACYDVPVGVPVESRWADVVTLSVTALEIGAFYAVVRFAPALSAVPPVSRLLFG